MSLMASAFSHIAVPVALQACMGKNKVSWKLLLLGSFLSIAPDFDSIGFLLDIPYESQWGHRGFTHSIIFALIISILLMKLNKLFSATTKTVFIVSFLSMVSHGILDALTNGGLGVAFFWPLNSQRYFFPWQGIEVSPIGIKEFFTEAGYIVIKSELLYIWLPCIIFCGAVFLFKKFKSTEI